jgi:dipeptidyl aminopeptidase/acylaminoacyl peptidase
MTRRSLLIAAIATILAAPASAQQPRTLTTADYARAERFLGYSTTPLVFGASVRPVWLTGDRFWYRNAVPEGAEFVLVDPVRRTRERAFDHARLAAALSQAADTTLDAFHLPFQAFVFSADGRSITFDALRRHWTCGVGGDACSGEPLRRERSLPNAVLSPDSTKAAFIRDYNLWARDVATGRETQLTTDGAQDFSYATDNAGWTKSDRPIVLWSPDSRKIATFQQDERGVGMMYLVRTQPAHPALEQWHYPLPGDSIVTTIQRVIIDLDGPRTIRLRMAPDQHRSTLCDHIVCGGGWADVYWSPDATRLVFVSTSRDHRVENLRVADAATGELREVYEERVADFFESGYNKVNWQPLWATNELLWYSERSDWGHLYLYDLATGQLKNPITSGNWKVLQVLRVDEASRTIFFTAAGREPGDPYFRRLYSVRMDGTRLQLLTPEDGDHEVALAPDGRYFTDTYSKPDVPPVTLLRDATGRTLLTVQTADISRLLATGWKPPLPFTVKARDGRTDLFGLLFRPTDFDSTRRYPIVNNIYPGPVGSSVGSRSFSAARGDCQALAELGFVVIQLDGMGTQLRSHSFMAAYYGDMGDNGLPDQVAGMRQLAQRYRWIDLDRAGIWGHSGGGFASADAILRYPDFFKVAVSQAGNHDNGQYEDDWGEKWQGLLTTRPDGGTSYDNQANHLLAANLRGKLLLAHGTTDDNVPPYSTLLLVDALIRANKDFDLLLLPNRRHGFSSEPYMMRRRWDYFVRHLMGAEPPAGYEFHPPAAAPGRPAR